MCDYSKMAEVYLMKIKGEVMDWFIFSKRCTRPPRIRSTSLEMTTAGKICGQVAKALKRGRHPVVNSRQQLTLDPAKEGSILILMAISFVSPTPFRRSEIKEVDYKIFRFGFNHHVWGVFRRLKLLLEGLCISSDIDSDQTNQGSIRDISPHLPSVRALLFVSSPRHPKLTGMLLDKASSSPTMLQFNL
jgi:hypothetical protein